MKNALDKWQLKAASELTHTLLTHCLWPQILINADSLTFVKGTQRDYYHHVKRLFSTDSSHLVILVTLSFNFSAANFFSPFPH